jgi:AcrR family transcriptional regulator
VRSEPVEVDERDSTRVKRHRRVTRERLLEAAAEVFAERGVLGARVEEVCERAGFTRGAFYSNFGSMEELIVAVLDQEGSSVLAQVSEAVDASALDPEPMVAVTSRIFSLPSFGSANYLLRGELSLLAVRDPELAKPYLAVLRQTRERFIGLLESSVASAGRRLTVKPEDAIDALQALFDASVRAGAVHGTRDPDGLIRRMLPVLLAAFTEPLEQGR